MPTLIEDSQRYDTDEVVDVLRRIQPALRPTDDGPNTSRSDGYDLIETLGQQYTDIYDDIEQLYDERLVQSASGSHLDRLGAKFDVERKTNETDDELRTRIIATRKASLSDGSYSDIADVAATALDVNPSQLNIRRPSDTNTAGTAEVRVSGTTISNAPLSQSTIDQLLSDAAVAGHTVDLISTDVFTFGDASLGFGTDWASE